MENEKVLIAKILKFLGEKPSQTGNSLWKIFYDKYKRIKIVLTVIKGEFHIYLHIRPFNVYKNTGKIVLDEMLNQVDVYSNGRYDQIYLLSKVLRTDKPIEIPEDFFKINFSTKHKEFKNSFSISLNDTCHRESDVLINNILERIRFLNTREAESFIEDLNTSRSFVNVDKVAKKFIEYPSKLKDILLRTSAKRKAYTHQCVQKLPESFIIDGRQFNILEKLNLSKELKRVFSSNEKVNLDHMLFNTLVFKINYSKYFLRVTIKCVHEEGNPHVTESFIFEVVDEMSLASNEPNSVISGYGICRKIDVNGKVSIDY